MGSEKSTGSQSLVLALRQRTQRQCTGEGGGVVVYSRGTVSQSTQEELLILRSGDGLGRAKERGADTVGVALMVGPGHVTGLPTRGHR